MAAEPRTLYKVYGISLHRSGEAGMSAPSHSRTNIAVLLAILALSGATMVWLFWHFPVVTALATLAILAVLGVCARLARLSDADRTDLQHKQGV